jgi:hypothetical protein
MGSVMSMAAAEWHHRGLPPLPTPTRMSAMEGRSSAVRSTGATGVLKGAYCRIHALGEWMPERWLIAPGTTSG